MKGRKPQPRKVKELKGNPGKRKLAPEPKHREGVPPVPDWLDKRAKEEWVRIVAAIMPGLLSQTDQMMLACYCEAASRYARTDSDLVRDRAFRIIRAACSEFGLSPAARARLLLPESKVVDKFEEGLKVFA